MTKTIWQDKIVIFGAGKIGRSFIGQLFSRGGYEVVFIDVYQQIINELNIRKCYNVNIKSEWEEIINITNVRGVHGNDAPAVAFEVATAGLVAISVGLHGLNGIIPLLAKGLQQRFAIDKKSALDIIIAENMRNADTFFREELGKIMPKDYPFDKLVGLVETSIGKMVPIMLKKDVEEDILQVFAEPYNTLILDRKAFKNPIPQIPGLSPKENMKAWVDRKLFIHNLGHAATAYIGFLHNPGFVYLYEALAMPAVHDMVRETMEESADILLQKYPDEFSKQDLNDHISDLLIRFQNKALGDTIFRVGCDLSRKLGPEDRLSGAIKAAILFDLPYSKVLYALICGFHFRSTDEHKKMLPQDIEFVQLYEKGIAGVLTTVCCFDPIQDCQLFEEARAIDGDILIQANNFTFRKNFHEF